MADCPEAAREGCLPCAAGRFGAMRAGRVRHNKAKEGQNDIYYIIGKKKFVQDMMKKNAEAIDAQGWLHSGDKGMITEAGMVKITGRYKELTIGEGGENIAPVPIEDAVKKTCDGLAE
eukprot:16433946-Heterocapsa_arctica.AAC.1